MGKPNKPPELTAVNFALVEAGGQALRMVRRKTVSEQDGQWQCGREGKVYLTLER